MLLRFRVALDNAKTFLDQIVVQMIALQLFCKSFSKPPQTLNGVHRSLHTSGWYSFSSSDRSMSPM